MDRKASDNRRRDRQREGLWSLLHSLPPPWGAAAPSTYTDLHSWSTQQGLAVQWDTIPATCEPCALLSNPANRGKKHGRTVLQQLDELQYSKPDTELVPAQNDRGLHKRWQVESFVAVLRRLVEAGPQRPLRVVDFGCGTGALMLPLACMFPDCSFTGVDMKPAAVAILRQRAAAAGLTNVHTFLGQIEHFQEPFDVALALHACGNATDAALLKAQQNRAAYIVSPCCVGKLKFSLSGGTSFAPANMTWRWMPRLSGTEEEVCAAGESLLSAAGGVLGGAVTVVPGMTASQTAAPQASEATPSPDGQDGAATTAGQSEVLPELTHPRSQALLHLLQPDPQRKFKLMAQLADTNFSIEDKQSSVAEGTDGSGVHAQVLRKAWTRLEQKDAEEGSSADAQSAVDVAAADPAAERARKAVHCALAKLHVELDRNEQAREVGYGTAIMRMVNAHSMAKGDLLVGVPCEVQQWRPLHHLLQTPAGLDTA